MSRVVGDNRGVALVLSNGERVVIARDDSSEILTARLREALEAFRGGKSDDVVASLVARNERNVSDWLGHLRGLRAEAYRTSSLDDEALLRIVEDPAAAPDARAGAVVLLRKSLDDDGRKRIRVASEATAEPHLRVALDGLVDAEHDEEVEAHLTQLAD